MTPPGSSDWAVVALKLLAASLAEDESFRDRFLRESELAASIDHPNIEVSLPDRYLPEGAGQRAPR